MTLKDDKARLRKERLAARDALSGEERIEKSLDMGIHAEGELRFAPGTVISGFLPIRSEPDLRPLMARLRERGARVCVPVILDRETIVFRELLADGALVANGFGTFAPGPEATELDPDILLVPLSAFDGQGNRIGYGGGYYDRAIERLHKKDRDPQLIGIAFDCQEVASVPAEPHDVGLNAVLTESGVRRFNRRVEQDAASFSR